MKSSKVIEVVIDQILSEVKINAEGNLAKRSFTNSDD
jgi:hypothetical protein